MKLFLQFILVFGISLAGEALAMVLPIPFPGSILSMLLLFALLLLRWVKLGHIRQLGEFLLGHMGFFFLPASVSILEYFDILGQNLLPFLVICFVSTLTTFAATAFTVRAVSHLQNRRRLSKAAGKGERV